MQFKEFGALQFLKTWFHRSTLPEGTFNTKWETELPSEVEWWERYFQNKVEYDTTADIQRRLDPHTPFQNHLRQYVDNTASILRILDIGSGPLSLVGTYWQNGPTINLYAVDPLVKTYDRFLKQAGISPKTKTVFGKGENLSRLFNSNFFDLIFSHNALDHSFSPIRCFRSMYRVLKPGGFIYAAHFPNEGHNANYEGLHQWNFDIHNQEFCIWNKKNEFFLKDYLPEEALISSWFDEDDGKNRIVVVSIKKYGAKSRS